MKSGLEMNDISIGKLYGFWVYYGISNDSFSHAELIVGRVFKKGQRKVALAIETWNKSKWKYPSELTPCF
jgi:hypothetical protein